MTRLLFGNRKRSLIYGLGAFAICFSGGMFAAQGQHLLSNMLFSMVVVLVLDLFGRSLFCIIKEKRKEKFGFVTFFITGICIFGIFFFLFAKGFGSSRIDVYRQMAGDDISASRQKEDIEKNTVNLEKFRAQMERGGLEVSQVTYGVEDSCTIPSRTVDLSAFAERSVLTGACMQMYFGYDLDEAPVAGKMWYPKDKKNCPVLFIVHGNHDCTKSLARRLAPVT